MLQIIEWCNNNYGFIAAILSVIGVFLSLIAIFVSIRTSRLPLKKEIRISSYNNFGHVLNNLTQGIEVHFIGISIEAVNVGYRNVNITYLGLGFKERKPKTKNMKLANTQVDQIHIGVIKPTEIASNLYNTKDLLISLEKLSPNIDLFIMAQDSEGKCYYKRIGKVRTYVNFIKNCLSQEDAMYGIH